MQALAFANNDMAIVAWTFGGKLPGCVGFAVYRVDVATGKETCLPAHEMGFARHVSSKATFLHDDVIEEQGPPDQVFGDPISNRCRRFVAGLTPVPQR